MSVSTSAQMAEEFIVDYKELLRDLSNTEKIKINTLTMLAEDNKPYAQTIVTAIEQHLGQVRFISVGR